MFYKYSIYEKEKGILVRAVTMERNIGLYFGYMLVMTLGQIPRQTFNLLIYTMRILTLQGCFKSYTQNTLYLKSYCLI